MIQPRDVVFVVYALPPPMSDALPIDISAFFFGGNLAVPTHIAEPCTATVEPIRETGRLMRLCAKREGVELRFAKLVWAADLLAWAERAGAKVTLAPPALPVEPLSYMNLVTGEFRYR